MQRRNTHNELKKRQTNYDNLLFTFLVAVSLLLTIGKLTLQAATSRMIPKSRIIKAAVQHPSDTETAATSFNPTNQKAQPSDGDNPEAALLMATSKVSASDGAASDAFGRKVAISGNTAVIGSPLSDMNGKADQGAVYVYINDNGGWSQQAKITINDGNTNSQFGYALGIDGDTIVIGERGADPSDKGAAYVFVLVNGNWLQQAKLVGNDTISGDRFGEAVAISGNTVVVGAVLHDTAGSPNVNKGAAYIFTRAGATWAQQAKLTASTPQDFDFFGSDVAIDGNTVLIAAPESSGDVRLGSAYVFTRTGNIWAQQAKLQSSDLLKRDGFGDSVSLSGDTAVVGATAVTVDGHIFQGAAYVFTRSGASWSQQTKLTADDGENNSYFGFAVSLKNQMLAVGAYGSRIDGKIQQGAAYLFTRTSTGWSQQAKLTANDGVALDFLGTTVAVDGESIIAGAPQKGVNRSNSVDTQQRGAAYFFSAATGIPKVLNVSIKGKKLIVNGTGFEAPTVIYLNGKKQKKTSNDESSPTTTVIAAKSGNQIAPGETVMIQVRNSNTGNSSNEFLFTRPVE
jgi:hypothetical protein